MPPKRKEPKKEKKVEKVIKAEKEIKAEKAEREEKKKDDKNEYISCKICLEPAQLGASVYTSNILTEIKKKYIGRCTIDHGYITDIDDDIVVLDSDNSEIINCSSVMYDVKFKIKENIKPVINNVIIGRVLDNSPMGIVLCHEKLEKMKLFIPITKCENFKFNSEEKIFVSKSKTIKIGDLISFKITRISYAEQIYSCIGEMV